MATLDETIDQSPLLTQLVPLTLTVVVMAVLIAILHLALMIFNMVPASEKIFLSIRWIDVIIGGTIYLKTSIDFAIFIGRMMAANPGWRNRIAIEIGTAGGNALGTMIVIGLWVILKNVDLLLAIMVLIASLVLFELAHGSLEHFGHWESGNSFQRFAYGLMHRFLDPIKKIIDPVLSRIMPDLGKAMQGASSTSWRHLLIFSGTVPFILGLDDFAGYVPLFNVVNVYGFAIGVIGAHTLLNLALFLSPKKTIETVKNDIVSFIGAVAFIGLGIYGLVETVKIVLHSLGGH